MSKSDAVDKPSEALVRAVEAGRRKLVRGTIARVVISVALLLVAIAVIKRRASDPASAVFAATALLFLIALLPFGAWSARHAWRPRENTVEGLLSLEVERRNDLIRRMHVLRVLLPALMAADLLQEWLVARAGSSGPSNGQLGISCAVWALLFWQAGVRRARAGREKATLLAQLAELVREEAEWSDDVRALYERYPFDAARQKRLIEVVNAGIRGVERARRVRLVIAIVAIIVAGAATAALFHR
jgi:hypothetical protein